MLANLVVIQYGRGALRSAAEQGARVGSVAGVDSCEETMRVVVSDLLGGRMSDEIQLSCGVVGSEVVATVAGRFQPWIPLVPSFEASLTSSAALEPSL